MTTALAIVTQGYRESNLLAIRGTLTDEQVAEGLERLNALIASVFGFEAGTKLSEWPVGTSTGTAEISTSWTRADWQYPPQNVQLLVYSPAEETIFLPPFPDNGARIGVLDVLGQLSAFPITLDGNGKLVDNEFSIQIAIDEFGGEWFYRSDLASWLQLTSLLVDSEMPFPLQFDDLFQTLLAMRLNPRYGRSIDPQTKAILDRSMGQLRAMYRQKREVRAPEAVLRMPNIGNSGFDDTVPPSKRNVTTWMR